MKRQFEQILFSQTKNKVFRTELNRLNYIKSYGPEKCPVLLILLYVGVNRTKLKRK